MTKWGRKTTHCATRVHTIVILMFCSLRKMFARLCSALFTIELCVLFKVALGYSCPPGEPQDIALPALSAPCSCHPVDSGLANQRACCSRTAGSEGKDSLPSLVTGKPLRRS